MHISQEQIFFESEGNGWFARNKSALEHFDPEADLPLRLMQLYGLQPSHVLEIGASNGFRLACIAKRYGARVVGVEPSLEAIQDGQKNFPEVEFVHRVAYDTFLKNTFDLIIVNFVFHWIDRIHLLGSVAEADRLLAGDGFLIVGDFYPSHRTRVRYHHLPEREVYTYKQNYAEIFLSSGLYSLVSSLSADHASKALRGKVEDTERIGAWLLRKQLPGFYTEAALPGK